MNYLKRSVKCWIKTSDFLEVLSFNAFILGRRIIAVDTIHWSL